MRRVSLFFRTLVFAVLFLAGSQILTTVAAAQSFTSSEGRFTVFFPGGEPKQQTESVQLKSGDSTKLFEFWTESDNSNVSYMVMYNDYSPEYATGDPQVVLASTRDGMVKGKTLVTDNAVSLNGVPGRAFTAKDDHWNYSVRQYLKSKRLYQLIVVSNNDHPATQTDQFMNSFSIW
jgi:hypothetical protein